MWLTVLYEDKDEDKFRVIPYKSDAILTGRVTALEALGGRFRGPHAGNVAYRQTTW